MMIYFYSLIGKLIQLLPKYKKIKIFGLEAVFYIPIYNPYICMDILKLEKGTREPELYKWLNNIKENFIYFDVGTSYGQEVSLLSTKAKKTNSKIFGFDCSLSASHFCALNKEINNNNFEFIFAAVSNSSGDIVKIEATSDINKSHKYSYQVLTLKLDDFCKTRNIYPTHMKIDIDGAELNIIKGAQELFERQELKEVFLEVNDNYEEIVSLLKKHKFEITWEKTFKRNKCLIFKR